MKKLVVGFVGVAALATAGMAAANHAVVSKHKVAVKKHHVAAAKHKAVVAEPAFVANGNSARGVYVNAGVGVGFVDVTKGDYATPASLVTSLRDYGFAWAANLGFQFNQYVALEAGYINFGQTKATIAGSGTGKNTFGGFDAVVKGIYPLTSQFDIFGKAGAVDMHDDLHVSGGVSAPSGRVNKSAWTGMLAVGTAFNVNHNVALTVEDDYAFRVNYTGAGFSPAINSLLAGASYKFSV